MSYYNFIKTETKNMIRNESYNNILTNLLVSMFDYKNSEDILYKKTLEMALRHGGYAMTTKDGDKLVTCLAVPVELPNDNGEYIKFFGIRPNGKEVLKRTRDVDCVIWQNNDLAVPDLDIERASEMLSEIDKSMVNIIRFTRYMPIPVARSSKDAEQIKDIQNALEKGNLKVLTSHERIDDIVQGAKAFETIEISDPTISDKFQNLSIAHDDIMRRFCTMYGQNMTSTPKKAQQSIEEINNSESYSFVMPLNNLKNRMKAVEKINEMYGTDLQVEFSETWAIEYSKYNASIEEIENENMNENTNENIDENMNEKGESENE